MGFTPGTEPSGQGTIVGSQSGGPKNMPFSSSAREGASTAAACSGSSDMAGGSVTDGSADGSEEASVSGSTGGGGMQTYRTEGSAISH